MADDIENSEYVTLGRQFRTPAHPEVLAALGRAVYSFFSFEESVTAIVYHAGAATLPEMRRKVAGAKETALTELAKKYRFSPEEHGVAHLLDDAIAAFGDARVTVRNELLHAYPFTAGRDNEGAYLPGLAYTAQDGQSWKTIAQTPQDLLDLAIKIESTLRPVNAAREAVQALALADLAD